MDLFEHLMVLVSIVVGLGLTQLLRGLAKMVRSSSRYHAVTLWAIGFMLVYIQVWWGMWDFSDIPVWTQLSFAYVVVMCCALFWAAELLVSYSNEADLDWREHFLRVRPWFYGTFGAALLLVFASTWVMHDVSLLHPYRIFQALLLGVLGTGLLVKSPQIHTWLAVAYLTILVVSQAILRLLPTGLT